MSQTILRISFIFIRCLESNIFYYMYNKELVNEKLENKEKPNELKPMSATFLNVLKRTII